MRFFRNANFDFLAQRRRAYMVSGAMLLVGIISLVLHGGPRYGVDFTGGTLIQVEFAQETSVADLRSVLSSAPPWRSVRRPFSPTATERISGT